MTSLVYLLTLVIVLSLITPMLADAKGNENISPAIHIVDPEPGATFVTGSVLINGTASPSDPGSEVKIVEVFVHEYPFNGTFHYENATQK